MGPVQYKNRKFRLFGAFAASLFMLIYGKPFDIGRALGSSGFYLSLAISFAAGLILVEFVHSITVKLDKKYGWRTMFTERLIAQALLAVLIPTAIDFLFFSVYFRILGQCVYENGFFHIDLPAVTGFLTLLSFYYCLRYWMLTDKRNVQEQLELAMTADRENKQHSHQEDTVCMEYKGERIYFNLENILYFYRLGRNVYFVIKDGQQYPIHFTIGSLEDRYGKNGFIRINRGMIINIKIIIGYKPGTRKNTLQLIIHENYNDTISELGKEQFQVTKEYMTAFRDRFGD